MKKIIPGTNDLFDNSNTFDNYKKMIELGNGVTLGQICNITKLEPHVIQNWVKRGYIPHPVNKKYFTKHLARILLINALRKTMYIEDVGKLMVIINGDVDDESDDLISEEDLYKLFSNIIYKIDDLNDVDRIIDKKVKKKVLNSCMKVMIYAYIASEFSKKSQSYFNEIK